MTDVRRKAWNPDARWADPLLLALVLLATLFLSQIFAYKQAHPGEPARTISLQGRVTEILQAAHQEFPLLRKVMVAIDSLEALDHKDADPWDQALLAILAAEAGDTGRADTLVPEDSETLPGFRKMWDWAYRNSSVEPCSSEQQTVFRALKHGYAARKLEARLLQRAGRDTAPVVDAARRWTTQRFALLIAIGGSLLALGVGGCVFGLVLIFSRRHVRQPELPIWRMSGRALAIVCLVWFLLLLVSGSLVNLLLHPFPALHAWMIPCAYTLHAGVGLLMLCRAEGLSVGEFWKHAGLKPSWRTSLQALGFWALALCCVFVAGLIVAPLLKSNAPAQKELLDRMTDLPGGWPMVITFITVAVLAPLWEEALFRGVLLPWLGSVLHARGIQHPWSLAVVGVGLVFASIHLTPAALPTLSTLGALLGFAFIRSGNLFTAVLVHALWNGSTFLVMQALVA